MSDGERESEAGPAASRPTPEAVSPLGTEVFGEAVKPDDVQVAVEGKPVEVKTSEKDGKEKIEVKDEKEPEVSALREWLELIARATFWALILYLFFFQVSVVDGPSMQPNFQTYDRLVIDKLTYRFLPVRRFDVVVFQAIDLDGYSGGKKLLDPAETPGARWIYLAPSGESKDYIKRVIGLPGEHVKLKGATIFIDGKPLEERFDFVPTCYFGADEFVVPPKHYFVMGDNRVNSKDSRTSGLGFIPLSQIRGIARLRFMPLGRWKWFWRY